MRTHTGELRTTDRIFPILVARIPSEGICGRTRRFLFFKSDSKCDFSKATFGKIRQKATDLIFFCTFFFCPLLQKKAALAPGAWPKNTPRGGGNAAPKGPILACKFFWALAGQKNRRWRAPKRAYFWALAGQNREC